MKLMSLVTAVAPNTGKNIKNLNFIEREYKRFKPFKIRI